MNLFILNSDKIENSLSDKLLDYFCFDYYKLDFYSDIDAELTKIADNYINDEYYGEKINRIFIPVNLSTSNADFSGLRLVQHILYSVDNKKKYDGLIFVYGGYDLDILIKSTKFASVFEYHNIHYLDLRKINIEYNLIRLCQIDYLHNNQNTHNENDKINLDETHHSLMNDISLYYISKYLNCYDDLDEQLRSKYHVDLNIKNYLFKHKYIKTNIFLNNSEIINFFNDKKKIIKLPEKINILLLDDYVKKKWDLIFDVIIRKINSDLNTSIFNLIYPDFNFNEFSKNHLINEIINFIENNNISLIYLDLRIQHDDYYNNNYSELTGNLLIKEIKKKFKNIQICIFTASNKIWNYRFAKNYNVFDFIIKSYQNELPDFYAELYGSLVLGALRSAYVTQVYNHLRNIINTINKTNFKNKNELIKNLHFIYDAIDETYLFRNKIFSTYANPSESNFNFDLIYLQLFICFESFIKGKYFIWKNNMRYLKIKNKSILLIKKIHDKKYISALKYVNDNFKNEISEIYSKKDTESFFYNIIALKLNLIYKFDCSDLINLRNFRNAIAHNNESKSFTNESHFLRLMEYFIVFSNENNFNIKIKSLDDLTG